MGSFAKNTIFTFLSRVSQLLLGFLTSVMIARALGPENNGIYSLIVLIPAFLIIFTDFGLTSSIVFYIGSKKYSLREIFGTSVILSALIIFVSLFIGLIIIFLLRDDLFANIDVNYLFLALSLIPFKIFLNLIVNVLLGIQKIIDYNLVQLINAAIFLVLVGIFLLGSQFSIRWAVLSEIISLFIACSFMLIRLKKEIGGIILSWNKILFKDMFSYGIKSYLGNVGNFLHLKVDVWMIGAFLNPLAVGLYSVSAILAEKLQMVSQSVSITLFPRVASEREESQIKSFTPLVLRNTFLINLLVFIVIFLLSGWLVTLFYSKEYSASILPFQILLIGATTYSGYRIIAYDLAGRGKPLINTIISLVSLFLNVLLNMIFIPKFGIVGAAWATAISYTFTFILSIIFYIKISKNGLKDIFLLKRTDIHFYVKSFMYIKDKFTLKNGK